MVLCIYHTHILRFCRTLHFVTQNVCLQRATPYWFCHKVSQTTRYAPLESMHQVWLCVLISSFKWVVFVWHIQQANKHILNSKHIAWPSTSMWKRKLNFKLLNKACLIWSTYVKIHVKDLLTPFPNSKRIHTLKVYDCEMPNNRLPVRYSSYATQHIYPSRSKKCINAFLSNNALRRNVSFYDTWILYTGTF